MASSDAAPADDSRLRRRRDVCAAIASIAFAIKSGVAPAAFAQSTTQTTVDQQVNAMTRIRITLASGKQIAATLGNNPAARDFSALLPLTLTLNDYHKIEKVSDLPTPLNTQGEPEGYDPDVGDITYYAPWGNLAIFYQDFGYASGLVKLGKIEAGFESLHPKDPIVATIEKAH